MKLRITHFFDPEPFLDGNVDVEDYSQAHSAWKARQLEPKFIGNLQIGSREWSEIKDKFQHYEENKLRYEGVKYQKGDRSVKIYLVDELIRVDFFHNTQMVEILIGHNTRLLFENGLSVSLFEQICQENNIPLKKIES